MTERLQLQKFQTDANQMAIKEAGWIRAWEMGDEREFSTYFESGLKLQYRLDDDSAQKATQFLLEFLRTPEFEDKSKNLFEYHRIISEVSGIGFDPLHATKLWLEIEKTEHPTAAQLIEYRSVLFGGVSGQALAKSAQMRKEALDQYQSTRETGESTKETGKAFANLVGNLAASNELFNVALMNNSNNLV